MKKDMFPLSGFIDDCIDMVATCFAQLDDLYRAYRIWASSEGLKAPMTKVNFNQVLRNSSLDITHEKTGYRGMVVRPMMNAENDLRFK